MKFTVPFLILMLCARAGFAQDSVTLNNYYRPLMVYHQVFRQTSEVKVDFDSTSQSIRDKLTANGQGKPEQSALMLESTTRTGKPDGMGDIPLITDFTHAEVPADTASPEGLRLLGSAAPGQVPVYHTVEGSGKDTAYQDTIVGYINRLLMQSDFVNRRMGLGESYTHTVTQGVVLDGQTVTLRSTYTYALITITAGHAHFVLTLKGTMDPPAKPLNLPLRVNAEGTGSLDYNTRLSYMENRQISYVTRIVVGKNDRLVHLLNKVTTSEICQANLAPVIPNASLNIP